MADIQALQRRKVIFFTATKTPTPAELALANAILGVIQFRAPEVDGVSQIPVNREEPDAVAAADPELIPDAFSELDDVTGGPVTAPAAFRIFASKVSIAEGETLQLGALGLALADGVLSIEDFSADELVDWDNDEGDATATVSATGLVTGVAAGSVTITASYEYGEDDEENPLVITDEVEITVTGD